MGIVFLSYLILIISKYTKIENFCLLYLILNVILLKLLIKNLPKKFFFNFKPVCIGLICVIFVYSNLVLLLIPIEEYIQYQTNLELIKRKGFYSKKNTHK